MLEPEAVSLPSGILQNWPPGSPLTLYTLAALMISQSDNTAADQLLRTLGRYQVEKILPAMGHSDPMRNVPFLSTVEMFKLKGGPEAGKLYLAKDPHTRRVYLESEISRQSHRHLAPLTRPSYIDRIEWFASAADLCQAMNWIRKQTETGPTAMARDILAINSGLVVSKKPWHYIGYKGGSETGVLNVTFLLQAEAGDWYAFAASWNNETQPLDESKFFSLTERIIQLIQTEAGQSP